MGALLAAVQRRPAFRAVTGEVGALRKQGGAAKTTGRGDGLNQPRKARSGYIDWRTRSLWPDPVVAISLGPVVRAFGVHVAPLLVPTISIHGEVFEFTP